MATGDADVFSGATIVFGTTGFNANIKFKNLSHSGFTRAAHDVTHQGTTKATPGTHMGDREFLPGDFVDAGTITLDIFHHPDQNVPVHYVAETITITWPDSSTWAFSGFVTDSPLTATLDEVMERQITIKITGRVTFS